MNTKNKPDAAASPLRVPKAKPKLGLKVPTIAMPHEDLIRPEVPSDKPHLEIVPPVKTPPRQTTHTRQSSMSSHTRQTGQTRSSDEIAPTRNFQKVPNSITKSAIPEGLFVGKSKQLYDVLYGLTRGAIAPTRKIRISKTKLMKQSSIGSRITFDSCIGRLQAVGLLRLTVLPGEHEGNEFEIMLPEELDGLTTLSRQSSQGSQATHTSRTTQTGSAQKQDRLVSLETGQTSQSLNSPGATSYGMSNTSFKDSETDDEENAAFSGLIGELSRACERLTGKKPTARDSVKWQTLGELLILELDIAARRAGTVSNVPAFLTEVLRRKLMNQIGGLAKAKNPKIDTVGKDNSGEFEVKALDEQGREATLSQLMEFAGDDFLDDFKKWYTPEDWDWLVENLKG